MSKRQAVVRRAKGSLAGLTPGLDVVYCLEAFPFPKFDSQRIKLIADEDRYLKSEVP